VCFLYYFFHLLAHNDVLFNISTTACRVLPKAKGAALNLAVTKRNVLLGKSALTDKVFQQALADAVTLSQAFHATELAEKLSNTFKS